MTRFGEKMNRVWSLEQGELDWRENRVGGQI